MRRARLAAWALVLPVGVAAPALAQDAGLSFAGFGLKSDVVAVTARYPRSTRVGNYVYVRPDESHDHIYGVEVPGDGSRRVRITFEGPRACRAAPVLRHARPARLAARGGRGDHPGRSLREAGPCR